MERGVRVWGATYSNAALVGWFSAAGALVAMGVGVAMGLGAMSGWADALLEQSRHFGTAIIALYAVAAVAAFVPHDASIAIDDATIRITRGRRVLRLDRTRVRVTSLRWMAAPNHELGAVLALDDGTSRITIGIPDRRVGAPQGDCRSPTLTIDAPTLAQLGPLLGSPREVVSAGRAPTTVPRTLSVEAWRDGDHTRHIVRMFVTMFAAMLLASFAAFAVQSLGAQEAFEYALLLIVPATALPIYFHVTHHRRGKLRITVDPEGLTIQRVASRPGAKIDRCPLENATLHCGHYERKVAYGGGYEAPVLSIRMPGRAPVVIAASDARLRWTEATQPTAEPAYAIGSIDFRLLVTALGLSAGLRLDPHTPRRGVAAHRFR